MVVKVSGMKKYSLSTWIAYLLGFLWIKRSLNFIIQKLLLAQMFTYWRCIALKQCTSYVSIKFNNISVSPTGGVLNWTLVNVPGENRRTRRTRCDGWLRTRSMNCALCRGCFSTTCPRTCTKSSPPFWTSKRLRSRITSSSSCDHETTGLCLDASTRGVEVKPYFNSAT